MNKLESGYSSVKVSDDKQRFSLSFGNTTLQKTFSNLNQPLIFIANEKPKDKQIKYDGVFMGDFMAYDINDILKKNKILDMKHDTFMVKEFNKIYHRYTLELYSKEKMSLKEIVSIIQDTYIEITKLEKEMNETRKMLKGMNIYQKFFSERKHRDFLQKKFITLNARKTMMMRLLSEVNLGNHRIQEIERGELIPLSKELYSYKTFMKSIVITSEEELPVLTH
jgi:hypothetical protein